MSFLYHFGPYSSALLVSAAVALVLIPMLWQRRQAPGARYLAFMQIGVVIWALSSAFEAAALTLPVKLIWSKLGYLGIPFTPFLYYLFAWDYSQRHRILPAWIVASLFLFAVVTALLAFTNEQHGWIWADITLNEPYNLAIYDHGWWWWLFVGYAYSLLAHGVIMLLRKLRHVPVHFTPQVIALVSSTILPFAGNIIYVAELGPIAGLDLTPVSFALNSVLLVWGIYRQRIFELTPIARTKLIESMQDGMLVLDTQHRIVDANPALSQLLRLTAPTPIGQTPHGLFARGAQLVEALQRNQSSIELHGNAANPYDLEIQVTPLSDRSQRFLGHLLTFRDVSARKRAERALQQLNSRLEADIRARTADIQAEKERADIVLRSIDDAIAMVDATLRIEYVNAAFCRSTGFIETAAVGQPIDQILLTANQPADVPSSPLARQSAWQGEVQIRRLDGSRYDAYLRVAPIFAANETFLGFVTSHRDISQRKAMERAQIQFMDSVAHEFRTPLTNLKLYNDLLARCSVGDQAARYLSVQAAQVARLEHLVQDSIELFLLDNQRGHHNWEAVTVDEIVQRAVRQLAGKAERKRIVLQVHPPRKLPPLYGNAASLTQALFELIDNGLTYTPPGGRVTIWSDRMVAGELAESEPASRAQGGVQIVVADTGPGIRREERPYLFDRFFRGAASQAGQIAGTGLGLSIAKAVVAKHGGQLDVYSGPAGGTRATLWLPLPDPQMEAMTTAAPAQTS